jgi:hypothetical protein
MLIRDYNISHNKNTMYTKFQRLRNMYKIVLLSQTSFNLLSYTIHLQYFTGIEWQPRCLAKPQNQFLVWYSLKQGATQRGTGVDGQHSLQQ